MPRRRRWPKPAPPPAARRSTSPSSPAITGAARRPAPMRSSRPASPASSIGVLDADPRTAGQGVERLRAAGHRRRRPRSSRQRPAARRLPHPPASRPAVRHRQARGLGRRHDRPRATWRTSPITGDVARDWTHRLRARSRRRDGRWPAPRASTIRGSRSACPASPATSRAASSSPARPSSIPASISLSGRPAHAHRPPRITPSLDGEPEIPRRPGDQRAARRGRRRGDGVAADGRAGRPLPPPHQRSCRRPGRCTRPRPHGSLAERLAAAGLVEVDQRALGADNLRTFERA